MAHLLESGSHTHWLDKGFCLLSARHKLFYQGWGDESFLKRFEGVTKHSLEAFPIDVTLTSESMSLGAWQQEFGFWNGFSDLPDEVRKGRLKALLHPNHKKGQKNTRAILLLAATREENAIIRQPLAQPLARKGLDVFILENPYYGLRRAHHSSHSPVVATVSDQIRMNLATIEEALSLLDWMLHVRGYESVGVGGFSQGGYMSIATALFAKHPLAVAPLAAGGAAASVMLTGLIRYACDWKALAKTCGGELLAAERLKSILGFCDVRHYPEPEASHSTVLVGFERDGYVPPEEVRNLAAHWPAAEVRWIDSGHAGAVLSFRKEMREALWDSFERLEKWKKANSPWQQWVQGLDTWQSVPEGVIHE